MFKVMTIVGTRPELIKMSRVIAELDQHVDHLLVHTGQNYDYELNGLFFEDLGIREPDYFLEAVGENTAQTIARVIEKSDAILEKESRMPYFCMAILTHALQSLQPREEKFLYSTWRLAIVVLISEFQRN